MMLKDIHEPLMEGGDTAGNQNVQESTFSEREAKVTTDRKNLKVVGKNDFYNKQLDTFHAVAIDNWKDI